MAEERQAGKSVYRRPDNHHELRPKERRVLITGRDAGFAYDGIQVVDGLNFEVGSGDWLAIVGQNGSGKSTLINGILGRKALSGGSLTLAPGLLKAGIGFLPQQKDVTQSFPASVWEVVLSGRQNCGRMFYNEDDRTRAKQNLRRLDVWDLRYKGFSKLSGGQQQRVLLARALCASDDLLVMDEPNTGLDPAVTRQFYDMVASLNRRTGIAVVMVSHEVETVLQHASHILHIDGFQVYFGPAELYRRSNIGMRYAMGGGRP